MLSTRRITRCQEFPLGNQRTGNDIKIQFAEIVPATQPTTSTFTRHQLRPGTNEASSSRLRTRCADKTPRGWFTKPWCPEARPSVNVDDAIVFLSRGSRGDRMNASTEADDTRGLSAESRPNTVKVAPCFRLNCGSFPRRRCQSLHSPARRQTCRPQSGRRYL